MINKHIDELGNAYYTRKELESNDEEYLAVFTFEYLSLVAISDSLSNMLNEMNITPETDISNLDDEVFNYIREISKVIIDKYNELIDTFFVDIIVSEEEANAEFENDTKDILHRFEELLLTNNHN